MVNSHSLVVALLLCACTPVPLTPPSLSPELLVSAPPASATPRSDELQERIDQALADMPPDYEPRTEHLGAHGEPLWSNRLILEQSPYLLQHAHNPVDWHPWGEEAFTLARETGRPVLLSVGYSTCHWCHVMESESFEDLEIAEFINAHYVPIKVDREERPDVDEIYMKAVHLLNEGNGGWPMTVWLTPDREPFFAGTYFPARDGDRGSRRPGFLSLLRELDQIFRERPDDVAQQAAAVTARIQRIMAPSGAGIHLPGTREMNAALADAVKSFDSTWGGRKGRPKFPSSFPLRLLLRAYQSSGDPALLDMVELTLDRMAAGGIYDQIGGGFHRYSTDRPWLVPHFEKMLYDNALLAVIYLEAAQATGRERHAAVASDILDYVKREMTRPEGGFWSATDADSMGPEGHREEGLFFIWTPEEMLDVLGSEKMKIAEEVYGVTEAGNFEGENILTRHRGLAAAAESLGMEEERLKSELEDIRESLRETRAARTPPLLDDKMLTAWNGLMISAFATGARVLGDPSLNQIAIEAADAILRDNRTDGRLARSSRLGTARHAGLLDDYAFLCAGLLDLYESTADPRWLDEAMALDQDLEDRFADPAGGFFRTPVGHEELLVREKPTRDGALPSGNSVHVLNLLRLAELTTDARYTRRAESAMKSLGKTLRTQPSAMDEFLLAVDWTLDTPREIVVVLPEGRSLSDPDPFTDALRHRFMPNSVQVRVSEGQPQIALAERVPMVRGKPTIGGLPTAYLCEQGSCLQPTTDPAVLLRQLDSLAPSK